MVHILTSEQISAFEALNDYTFDALIPTSFPNNLDIRHSITLAGNYTIGNLKLGCGLNFKSGKPYKRIKK